MTNAPLPQAPPPDWRQYMLRAVIWVTFIAALGYAAAGGGLGFLENDIHLAAEPNRDSVKLIGGAPPVIQVRITLRNNTSEQVTLNAKSACKIFRWQIFARTGELVQSWQNEAQCPDQPVTAFLPSGKTLEEFYSIALTPERYQAGQDYLVQYQYWGREGEFQFRAE